MAQWLQKTTNPDFYDNMVHMNIKKQKYYKQSGHSTKWDKRNTERNDIELEKEQLDHNDIHGTNKETNLPV